MSYTVPCKSGLGLDHVLSWGRILLYRIFRTFSISFRLRLSPLPPFHSFLFYLSVFTIEHRRTSLTLALHARCHINDSVKFLHFGHRCPSFTSPCGSVTGECLIRSRFLFFATRLTRRIPALSLYSRIKNPAPGLVKGRHLRPTFSLFLLLGVHLLSRDRLGTNRACHAVNRILV